MKMKLRLPAWIITLAMMFSIVPASVSAAGTPCLQFFDESTNSINDGTLSTEETELHACFNNLIADEDYVVVISQDASDPLDPSSLVYITQTAASEEGTLDVPFRSSSSDFPYVAACRYDIPLNSSSITVIHGTASPSTAAPGTIVTITADTRAGYEFTHWSVLSGDVTVVEEDQPTTTFVMGTEAVRIEAVYSGSGSSDSGSSSSGGGGGGGDGAGVALLLGVGVATAVAAGVILTQPVDVKGQIEFPDHTPVVQAKIALLKDGKLVAQTVADENGSFALKVQRGSYEALVAYTDPETGKLISQTLSVTAPSKNLVLSFTPSEGTPS